MMAAHVAPGTFDVAGLGDHLEVAFAVEQHSQAAAHNGVIVGEDYADRLRGSAPTARASSLGVASRGSSP